MLKIAIIGTGGIANAHVKGYKTFPDLCRVSAVCDIYPEKAEKFSERHNLDAAIYDSYKTLIEKEQPDAVSLCLPPFIHKEICVYALKAGVNVLCEKPMASSVEECNEMLKAQKESGKLLGICHQNRFRNDIQEVKHVIDSGLLGKILFSRIDSYWWRSLSYYDLWWRGTWEKEGGGCILNHAVHHLDLMLWFMGKPESVYSLCTNLAHKNSEVEDFGTALLRFAGGSVAQFTGTVMCHGEDQQMDFQCENGKIVTPWEIYCSEGANTGFPDGRNTELEKKVNQARTEFLPLQYEKHIGAVRNFLEAVRGNEDLMVTGEDGKRVIELITLIYQSSVESRELPINIDSENPWYTTEGILKKAPRYYKKTKSIENMEGDIIVGQSKK